VLVDELVDRGLVNRFHAFELEAHPDPSIAPRDAAFRFDVALGARQPEAGAQLGGALERAHRADRQAALAQVQGERRGDGVAESVGDGNPEHDPGAAAAVEIVGKQVGRQRGQDVLHGAVLVDVPGNPQRREIADFIRAGNGAAEHQDRQPPLIDFPDRPHKLDPTGMGQPEIEYDQVDARKVRTNTGQQLRGALHREGGVSGAEERCCEPIPNEGSVVGDDDSLGGWHGSRVRRRHAEGIGGTVEKR
jgi:hypothetical protein